MNERTGFTSGKPWTVTAADLTKNWGNAKDGRNFRCGLCGYRFKEGDTARWQYTNSTHGASGNPFVCVACDGPPEDVTWRWAEMHHEANEKFWWFTRPCKADHY